MIPGQPTPAGGPPMGQPGQPPMQPQGQAPNPAAQSIGGQAAAPPQVRMVEQFNAPLFAQALQLLRDERQRGFRINIETDSTVALDQESEQMARVKFLQAVGSYLQSALPMMESIPQSIPLLCKMLMFGIRGFPIGVEMEGAFEDMIAKLEGMPPEALQQMAGGNKNALANAKTQAAQQQLQAAQIKSQAEVQAAQYKAQAARQDHQVDVAGHQMDMQVEQMKAQVDMQRTQLDAEQLQREQWAAQADHQRQMAVEQMRQLQPQRLPFMATPGQPK